MINVIVPEIAQTSFVGNLNFGRITKQKMSDLGLPHPENVVAWNIHAMEMLGEISNVLGFKVIKREMVDFAELFRDTNGADHEHGVKVAERFMEALIEAMKGLSLNKELLEEWGVLEDTTYAEAKKSLNATAKSLTAIAQARGHLVLFNTVHQVIQSSEDEIQDLDDLAWALDAWLNEDDTLTFYVQSIKEAHKEIVGWGRELKKQIKNLEYVDAIIDGE